MKRLCVTITVLAFAAVVLAGCASASPTPAPAELLVKAAKDLQALRSAKLTLARQGEPVIIDAATGVTFSEATGEYQAPDKVHAKIKVLWGSAVLSVDFLWLPEGVYMTNPLTGTYGKVSTPPDFNVAALFGASGLPSVLQHGLRAVKVAGKENLEGLDAYHLRGEADGSTLKVLTGGVLVEGIHTVDVWIETATSHILRLQDSEPGAAGNVWTLDLFAFDKPVEIKSP